MNENAKSSVSVYAAIDLSKSTWLVAVLSQAQIVHQIERDEGLHPQQAQRHQSHGEEAILTFIS